MGDPVHPVIGLLRALTSKVSRLSSHRATKESTEATWLVWESSHSSSRLVRVPIHMDLMDLRPSQFKPMVVTLRSAKTLLSRSAMERLSLLHVDSTQILKSHTTRTVEFCITCYANLCDLFEIL